MLLLLEKLFPTLWPLLKKWQTWLVLIFAALVLYILFLRTQLNTANLELAARPRVETKVQVQTKTVTVAGPVRTETKTVYAPGSKTIEYVDRVVLQEPATTTTEIASASDTTVQPACPAAAKVPWRSAGVLFDPTETSKVVGVRGAATLFKNFEIGADVRFAPRTEGAIETSVRF